MYLKRYTLGTLALMLFVGWYISQYLGYSQSESISFFGIYLPALPVSVLVLLPVFILYIASIFHMFYYSVKSFFHLRNYKKDYEMLVDMIMDELLNKDHHYNFKTKPYQLLAKVLENTSMSVDDDIELTENEKVNNILKILTDIKSGKVVDLKKLYLDGDNPLSIQNQKNRMMTLDLSSEEILNKSESYTEDILEKAYENYAATAPMFAIEKYQEYITKDALFIILARVNSEENTLEVSNESLLELMRRLVLVKADYLSISKELSIHMIPEQRTKLFEVLAEQDEEAHEAYLYTLFDLEMIDTAKEFLETQTEEEAMKFRAYLALKESGHNFNINLFI
ncbi:MAG: hypothetical protein COA44_05010 [Arcobacter sp.]|nr:MAG: hypothetical protein COA44_05010 [Arcobacter sp.]